MVQFDRATFLRPIAHRGWHNNKAGRTENSRPAFAAAIGQGYGIECDLRPAKDGLPVVFHDETLDRVTNSTGPIAHHTAETLQHVLYPSSTTCVITFEELLELVRSRVPLLVEIKSEWEPPDQSFLAEIARLSLAYQGPIALMSFDPAVLVGLRALAPAIPRGMISGLYESEDGDTWWAGKIDKNRAYKLAHLLESGPVNPAFIAYHVKALPTPVTRFVREVLGLPLFTWTVRDADDLARAKAWADAPIFEGIEPV
jgi:glycerophosphoryl diester phosphodiesterase